MITQVGGVKTDSAYSHRQYFPCSVLRRRIANRERCRVVSSQHDIRKSKTGRDQDESMSLTTGAQIGRRGARRRRGAGASSGGLDAATVAGHDSVLVQR